MPQDEQYDWPSFETVLRDVATSDAVAETDGLEIVEPAEIVEPPVELATPSVDVVEPPAADVTEPVAIDLLPEPLAPVDFDTSAVRALLEPIGTTPVEPFELDALAPLLPPAEADDVDQPEAAPPSVFDLAFDADAYTPATEAPAESALHDFDGIEIPSETPSTQVFDDLGIDAEISLDDVPSFADVDEETPDSTLGDADLTDLPSGAVFELDADAIDEGFDSVATANAIEGELNELNELSELPTTFDEVLEPADATADDDQVDDPFALNNVIPIRPEPVETETTDPMANSEWLNPVDTSPPDGPPATRISHTGWVGLDASDDETEAEESDADPWAYMRPAEEPKAEGFWAKVFGGDERKRARARRMAKKEAEATAVESEDDTEFSFDRACPNCGANCVVDLDDPIGRRVHVSCPDCDHMWNTPYLEAG